MRNVPTSYGVVEKTLSICVDKTANWTADVEDTGRLPGHQQNFQQETNPPAVASWA